ncbi:MULTISPECIES: hypothetical protein [unclassified Serratia (in: enterobacteria)]|uniref:hypothetical protein n=1 Tax=unclassified Serratia (in: enterobacteria) TaxID=2647522 RepID=UPI003076703E
MLSFNKQKKSSNESKAPEVIDQPLSQTLVQTEPAAQADVTDAIKPIRAKKDTFVSNGAQFTDVIEGDGNIIIEGKVEGNIRVYAYGAYREQRPCEGRNPRTADHDQRLG